MTTVPGPDTPAPANNAKTLLLQSDENLYVRPTAGNNAAPQGSNLGPGPTAPDAPAGIIPNNPIMGGIASAGPPGDLMSAYADPSYPIAQGGAPVTTGGTQAGADVGSGATIIAGQPDATGHPGSDLSGGGTVGDSGNQGAPSAPGGSHLGG